jgi:hypothetical protein
LKDISPDSSIEDGKMNKNKTEIKSSPQSQTADMTDTSSDSDETDNDGDYASEVKKARLEDNSTKA